MMQKDIDPEKELTVDSRCSVAVSRVFGPQGSAHCCLQYSKMPVAGPGLNINAGNENAGRGRPRNQLAGGHSSGTSVWLQAVVAGYSR
jgi:hypothetical protein